MSTPPEPPGESTPEPQPAPPTPGTPTDPPPSAPMTAPPPSGMPTDPLPPPGPPAYPPPPPAAPPAGPSSDASPPPFSAQQPPPYPSPSGSYPSPYQPAPPPAQGFGYGTQQAAAPPGTYWDSANEVAIPNGTTLASHGRRIGSWFLAIPLAIVTLGIGYVIWGLMVWGRGQTPALQVLGMRCWRTDNGGVPGWGQMALREFVGRFLLGFIPFYQIADFVVFLVTKQRRSIHDYVGGTIVVHDPERVLAPQA